MAVIESFMRSMTMNYGKILSRTMNMKQELVPAFQSSGLHRKLPTTIVSQLNQTCGHLAFLSLRLSLTAGYLILVNIYWCRVSVAHFLHLCMIVIISV